jgi:hypothetical protein
VTSLLTVSQFRNGFHRIIASKSNLNLMANIDSDSRRGDRWKGVLGCTYASLALFRITFGLLLTVELLLRFRFLYPFYTDHGVCPLPLLLNRVDGLYKILCIHCLSGELHFQQVLLSIQVILAMGISLGVTGTNVMCIISWFLYFSLTLRNTWLNYILDRYIHYLLFLSMFLPLNRCWSVAERKPTDKSGNMNASGWYISPATITMKLLVLWIYIDAGSGKFSNQGWSFAADPLPALDTYARHTLVAQYMTALWGAMGWRILTPLVVYVELGAAPLALLGSVLHRPVLCYTAVALIASLHIGISLTIRNAGLLSFIAITPWSTFLPLHPSPEATRVAATQSGRFSTIVSAILIGAMISGNIWLELISKTCDQSVTHIWGTLLHNRWNVFIGAEEYVTWEIAPGVLLDGSYVDVWSGRTTIDWRLPTLQSGGAPSTGTSRPGRWRSFPYLADFPEGSDEYHALWGYLCREWDAKHKVDDQNPGQRLLQYNFFMLQADVLPEMQFTETRKRLIASYDCSHAYMSSSEKRMANFQSVLESSAPDKEAVEGSKPEEMDEL